MGCGNAVSYTFTSVSGCQYILGSLGSGVWGGGGGRGVYTKKKLIIKICSFIVFRDKEQLLEEHKAAWKALWETGRIEIEGDLEMAQAVYGSMYYILSSTRSDWPYGLSPGGLPGGEEYMGHTFWDQDIWMYPPLVLLHPDLARSALKYRKDRLPAARRIAKEYGYKGN